LSIAAATLSVIGLVLCAGGVLGILSVALPEPPAFDLWFYLAVAGAFGLLFALCGLILGLLAWLPARRQGLLAPAARRAVLLSAVALCTLALALLVSRLYLWLAP
jgi:hypothetical protein